MDTNQAKEQYTADEWRYWESEWPSEEVDENADDIDYAGAKRKGKGKSQLCYNCGKPGHRAFECPEPKRAKGAQWQGGSSKGKGKGKSLSEMWNAFKSSKGKSGGKGKGFQGNCERCGKYGHKAKECRAIMPAREVEEEEKSEIDWACMIDEEA